MAKLIGIARRFRDGEAAATSAEYVLMAMLIGVACITALASLANALAPIYQRAVNGLS